MKNKPKRVTDLRENVGKVLVNVAQMMFGTLCLGGVLRAEMPHSFVMIAGFVGALLFVTVGLLMSAKEKQEEE